MLLARSDVDNVVHIGNSETCERSWHIVHADCGPLLVSVWYRPPGEDASMLASFHEELSLYSPLAVGCIVVGDMNIHHVKWLRHSARNSAEGELLHDICCQAGLLQHVRGPTRGEHLLDLVLSDLGSQLRCSILPELADHRMTFSEIDIKIPSVSFTRRQVWQFSEADWPRLKQELSAVPWREALEQGTGHPAEIITNIILQKCNACIPRVWRKQRPQGHPWLNERCREAVRLKCEAAGSQHAAAAAEQCPATLLAEFQNYQGQLREKIQQLPQGSKQWWRLNRELLQRSSSNIGIPPLKNDAGDWMLTALAKANLLADTLQAKCQLPPARGLEQPDEEGAADRLGDFLPLRKRSAKRILKALQEDSATGSDNLPARVLKICADELALPCVLLARHLLASGDWPDIWRLHWICALFKKGAAHDPTKYRGVHLTPVISKVVERIIASVLLPFLEASGAYGPNQWAYSRKRSCRDLVSLLVASWIALLSKGKKVGAFFSDISGAFDRVDSDILLRKLKQAGVCPSLLRFFSGYLSPRSAVVVVAGATSARHALANTVFQGTVLGPPLWNVFFQDVRHAVRQAGADESIFADDLNAFKPFASTLSNESVMEDMVSCQTAVHQWGESNRVLFDSSKEHFAVIHHVQGEGDTFKLLGVSLDVKLVMADAVSQIIKRASPKLTALLRTIPYYSRIELFNSYKAHILCLLEGSNGAIYHASNSILAKLDAVQNRFLSQMVVDARTAFLDYNLAPLQLRRDIGMLGLVFRCVKGLAHPKLCQLFARSSEAPHGHGTRLAAARHDLQLQDSTSECTLGMMHRSIFALVKVWNVLPSRFVHSIDVHCFQQALTHHARQLCMQACPHWQCRYCPRSPLHVLLL
jgi:hypothetical protein